jgi:hypothetical protein
MRVMAAGIGRSRYFSVHPEPTRRPDTVAMQAAATTFLRAGLVVPAGVALVVALHAIIAPASWRG